LKLDKNKKSRDKYQTIKEILLSLPGRQTHITFKAHLGHYQAKYYFKLLQESDMIRNHNSRFSITEKGKRYLYLLERRGPSL
jgi:predicted transcriptional regulator